jgi:hypothetical protein
VGDEKLTEAEPLGRIQEINEDIKDSITRNWMGRSTKDSMVLIIN